RGGPMVLADPRSDSRRRRRRQPAEQLARLVDQPGHGRSLASLRSELQQRYAVQHGVLPLARRLAERGDEKPAVATAGDIRGRRRWGGRVAATRGPGAAATP